MRSQWPYAVAIAAPIALFAAKDKLFDDQQSPFDLGLNMVLSIGAVYGSKKFGRERDVKNDFPNHETLCINTNPDKNTVNQATSEQMIAVNETKTGNRASAVFSGTITAIDINAMSVLLGGIAETAKTAYHFGKIESGDWVIEEMPPPKKKETEAYHMHPEAT